MRVINGETRWADDDWSTENGRPVHFILPKTEGGCIDQRVGSRLIRKFRVMAGDVSANEAKNYTDVSKAPARAMAVFEGSQRVNVRPYNAPLAASFLLNVQPGPRITADWLAIAQWNAAPLAGDRYRNPPASIGIKTIDGVEHLYFLISTLPYSSSTEQGRAVEPAPPVPMARGPHKIEMQFVDARGSDGMFRVTLDGVAVCDYAGPTGFANHAGCYSSYGAYRSPWCPGKETTTLHFENFHEGPIPSP